MFTLLNHKHTEIGLPYGVRYMVRLVDVEPAHDGMTEPLVL